MIDPIDKVMWEKFGLISKQEQEDDNSELIKQIREHKIRSFQPAYILRKKQGAERRYNGNL